MDNIIYKEELISDVILDGDFSFSKELSIDQQKDIAIQMMKNAGIDITDTSEYNIDCQLVSKENENSYKYHFKVTRTYKKEIPYRETREEVYNGEFILDGLRMTPEQQRQTIIDQMKNAGIDTSNPENLEINYVGADDQDGISETQSSKYTVYRVSEEKLSQEQLANYEIESVINRLHDDFVSLRDKMQSATTEEEMNQFTQQINDLSSKMDALMNDSSSIFST